MEITLKKPIVRYDDQTYLLGFRKTLITITTISPLCVACASAEAGRSHAMSSAVHCAKGRKLDKNVNKYLGHLTCVEIGLSISKQLCKDLDIHNRFICYFSHCNNLKKHILLYQNISPSFCNDNSLKDNLMNKLNILI